MSQCLRCGKACEATFCKACQMFLEKPQEKEEVALADVSTLETSPQAIVAPDPRNAARNDKAAETPVSPPHIGIGNPETPLPPVSDEYADRVEQALYKLRDAARRIAAVEHRERRERREHRGLRAPRFSRLAPLRDITADIQRQSTPVPHALTKRGAEQDEDFGTIPDLLPWLGESEESKTDTWIGRTDPLLSRHFPTSEEAARIEEEDIRRAAVEGMDTSTHTALPRHIATTTRLRIVFACLVILALLALGIDGILLSALWHANPNNASQTNEPPMVTLSSNVVTYGQRTTLYIRYFTPSSFVYLTHDINEPVLITTGKSMVRVGQDGSAKVIIAFDSTWNPGFHTLQAEDIKTRYTASATLQVNEGVARPALLSVSSTAIDMGAEVEGANSIQAVTLRNTGNGSISWAASSDQSWLQITPRQGVFSGSQTVVIGGQRTNLKQGDYAGTITLSSNVGTKVIQVKMSIRPLPDNVGPVMAMTPAVLSYIATDGGVDPNAQTLMINNPGSQPLYWSLNNTTPISSSQDAFLSSLGAGASWLSTDVTSGVVNPGGSGQVRVLVHSRNLLPGTYLNTLSFSTSKGYTAYNAPQSMTLSLTVQQPCSVMLSTASLSFTSIAGQGNPGNQTLNLGASTSCPTMISWSARSSANWLTITPDSGQVKGSGTATTTMSANASGMKPGVYTANVSIVTAQSTQSVVVQLTVQAKPPPLAPILSAAPLNLNFAANSGQNTMPGQTVTITNTGDTPLQWYAVVDAQTPWLSSVPASGTIAAGQAGQVTINVNPGAVTPGSYAARVLLNGTDAKKVVAGGSPQAITVNLTVSPPCALAKPSSSALAFSVLQGSGNPVSQAVAITATGNCNLPLNWTASVSGAASWLKIGPASGSFASGTQAGTLDVAPDITGLGPGVYTTQVTISATDSANVQAQSSPQTFSVSLTVQQPCTIQTTVSRLTFTLGGQSVLGNQSVNVKTSGACVYPVSWKASVDDGGSGWLNVDRGGLDTGNGSTMAVSVDSTKLDPGSYKGTITIMATDSGGNILQGSPQVVSVTLTIPGFTVSGTVNACVDNVCSSLKPFGGATVSLVNDAGKQVAAATSDEAGNYSFSNVAAGNYTISASWTDSTNVSYMGTDTISVNSDQQSIMTKILPS